MSTKVLYVSIWTATIAVAYLLGYLGQESSPMAREFEEKPEKHSAKKPKLVAAQQRVVRDK